MALPRVGPIEAAKYLQNGTTAQDIRLDAQEGISPFCTAKKNKGGRHSYRVNVGLLMKFKNGTHYSGIPTDATDVSLGKKVPIPSQQNWELLSSNTFTQEANGVLWEVIIKSWKKRDNNK